MTMVAIAFTLEKWKRLFEDDCDIDDMRKYVFATSDFRELEKSSQNR